MATTAPHSSHSPLRGLAVLAATACMVCAPFARESQPNSKAAPIEQLVELRPDIAKRDLFWGPGGRAGAPRTDAPYLFLERKEKGVSTNFELKDARGQRWDAKFGEEVKPEVAASRLLWAIGFHQPPVYYVREWRIANGPEAGAQPEARFRLDSEGWKKGGEWKWKDNPFTGTREMHGLIVMMAMLNSWDLKTSNNKIYETPRQKPERRYVVKDLGDTFGRSARVFLGTLSDVDDFAHEPFIRRVTHDHVELYFRPVILNWGVDRDITVEDVLWTCRRLARLSDRQWRDAFRAAGYSDEEGAAFASRLQAKVREGLALEGAQT